MIPSWHDLSQIHLDDALTAATLAAASGDSATQDSLRQFALSLARLPGDLWLRDYLQGLTRTPANDAAALLAQTIGLNAKARVGIAASLASQARSRFASAGLPAGIVRAQLEQLYALHRTSQTRQCVAEADRLLPLLRHRRYRWALAQTLVERSVCLAASGHLAAAERSTAEAASIAQASSYSTLHLRAMGMTATQLAIAGAHEQAWSVNSRGLDLFWHGHAPPVRAFQFYSELSYNAEGLGLIRTASLLEREAVGFIVLAGIPVGEASARHRLAMLAQSAGHTDEAAAQLSLATGLYQSLRDDPDMRISEIASEIERAAVASRQGRIEQPLARLRGLRSEVESLQDLTVSLTFFSTLADLAARRQDSAEAEQALQWTLRSGAEGICRSADPAQRAAWHRQLTAAARDLIGLRRRDGNSAPGRFTTWEWVRGLNSPSNMPPATCASSPPTANHHLIIPGATRLSFAESPDGLFGWLLDEDGLDSRWIPISRAALRASVSSLEKLCANPASSTDAIQREARALYRLLIGPWAQRIVAARTLVIEPDESLSALPFAVLSDADGTPLGLSHRLVISLGPSSRRMHPDRIHVSPSLRAVGVGAPALGRAWSSRYPPLPDAASEAESVVRLFDSGRLLTGRAATSAAVLSELPSAGVFHFAGHAALAGSGPALLLSPADEVSAVTAWSPETLGPLNLGTASLRQCRLAFLSACRTAGAIPGASALAPGLEHAMLQAGAWQVLASRWNTDSAVARRWALAFYRSLLQGASAPEARRAAALALAGDPATAHPHSWAVFDLFAYM